jgi:hypothetical protein
LQRSTFLERRDSARDFQRGTARSWRARVKD